MSFEHIVTLHNINHGSIYVFDFSEMKSSILPDYRVNAVTNIADLSD